jgi:hypothetical protein
MRFFLGVFAFLCLTACSEGYDSARSKAERWLNALPAEGLVMTLSSTGVNSGFVDYAASQPYSGTGPGTLFLYQRGDLLISLGFKTQITTSSPLETLQQQFNYIALDKLVAPNTVAYGWDVYPLTPVSSFSDGVEITSFNNGQIGLRVKTNFFALYGRRLNISVPADASLPEGTYFEIRKDFPLNLTIDLPLFSN